MHEDVGNSDSPEKHTPESTKSIHVEIAGTSSCGNYRTRFKSATGKVHLVATVSEILETGSWPEKNIAPKEWRLNAP